MGRCLLISVATVSVAVCYFTAGCNTEPGSEYRITSPVDPFWPVKELTRVSAMLYEYAGDVPTFDVPKDHWDLVVSALLPAEVYRPPDGSTTPAWEIRGEVSIVGQGEEVNVTLYYARNVGAFSIDGTYYRGGSNQEVELAIKRAYSDYIKR